jgi:O-antigen ligase
MEQLNITKLNFENIAKVFFFLFLISLFFPIRYVFFTKTAFITGLYSDFTSISLYLSDIFLITTWIFLIVSRGETFFHVVKSLKWLFFWLILAFLLNFGLNKGLNTFFFIKLLELFVAYGTAVVLFSPSPLLLSLKGEGLRVRGWFFKLFVILGSIQSILALWQFIIQSPIGLFKLGEQQIYPWNLGIAKIVVNGIKFVRGYGTFPHPNPLSAFLVVGIFFSIYFFLKADKLWQKVAYSCAILINILGLTVTFSRGAFLALGVGLVIYFGYLFFLPSPGVGEGQGRGRKIALLIIVFSLLTSFLIFRPYLLTRATISDQATVERGMYNQIGLKMIKDKPIFGVGIGERVLHMQQFSSVKLWPWQIQPIHNYFLLAAAELGIMGSLILIWIFLSHLKSLWLRIKDKRLRIEIHPLLFTILISFLVLMNFDHYFYTLQQTQLLLWVVLGLIAAESNQNQSYELHTKI